MKDGDKAVAAVLRGSQAGQPVGQRDAKTAGDDSGVQDQGNGTLRGQQAITKDEVLTLVDERLSEAMKRQAQSTRDIVQDRIDKEFGKRMDQLKNLNIQVDQQQADQLREQIAEEIEFNAPQNSAGGSAPEGPSEDAPPQGLGQDAAVYEKAVLEMMETAGVEIYDDDEELKLVDTSSATKILATLPNAIQKKKERLSREAKVRTPSSGGPAVPGNPIAEVKDMDKLYEMALRR